MYIAPTNDTLNNLISFFFKSILYIIYIYILLNIAIHVLYHATIIYIKFIIYLKKIVDIYCSKKKKSDC